MLTPSRTNTLNIIKQSIDRAMVKFASRQKRMRITRTGEWKHASTKTIDALWANIAARQKTPRNFGEVELLTGALLSSMLTTYYRNSTVLRSVEAEVMKDLHSRVAEYELLSQMPLPKRTYKRREKKSLVERRADKAAAKVAEWERKLKYAKTKLAAYRKKQKYYAKKGASV